jgi:putative oxidoreductase
MSRYPFVSLNSAFVLARIMTALFFVAHAAVRIVNGTIPQFGKFMGSIGFPAPEALVWAITLTELVCGTLLIVGRHVRLATIPLAAIAAGGIVLIHAGQGWFVGEHGTGGMEYSFALLVLLLLIAAHDKARSKAG